MGNYKNRWMLSLVVMCFVLILPNHTFAGDTTLNTPPTIDGSAATAVTTTRYQYTIEGETTEVDVEAIANDPTSTVTINGDGYTPLADNYLKTITLEDGDNYVTIEVTASDGDTRTYDLVITKVSFTAYKNGIIEGRPGTNYYHMIKKINNTDFEVRPNALKEGKEEVNNQNLQFVFTSVEDAPSNYSTIGFEGGQINDIAGGISYTRSPTNPKKLIITIPLENGAINLREGHYNKTYKLKINNVDFFSFTIMPEYRQPDLEAELIDNPIDYGILEDEKVYYIGKNSNLEYGSILLNSYPIDTTTIYYRKDNETQEINLYSQAFKLELDASPQTNVNFVDSLDPSVDSDLWLINIQGSAREELESLQNLKFRVVRAIAWREGSSQYTSHTHYFVQDDNEPRIEVRRVDGEGDEYGDSFGTYASRYPQLKAKLIDDISGIDSDTINFENIKVKIRPLQPGEDKANLLATGFENADEMKIIDLEDRLESRKDGDSTQILTFVPYDYLGEGEYVIKISAEDMAGNSSDDYDDGTTAGPFLFYLNMDQTGPRINNVSVNNKTIDVTSTKAQAVSPEGLETYFEIYGTEDFVYGIRYLGTRSDDGSIPTSSDDGWFIIKSDDISYITQYLRTDFLNHQGLNDRYKEDELAKNGIYEMFIIADEEGIYIDEDGNGMDDLSEVLNGANYGLINDNSIANDNIASDSASYIGQLIYEADNASEANTTLRLGRRSYVHFKVEVDKNPPEYIDSSLKYFDNYPDVSTFKNLTSNSNTDNVQQIRNGQPVFEIQLTNSSKISTDSISIYFENIEDGRRILGGVFSHKVDGRVNTIQFKPNVALTSGVYNLEIQATDEFGNTTVGNEEISKTLFTNVFEVVTTSGGILDFSITAGERLNINQSSALEINITDLTLRPAESLRVSINGAVIVAGGSIVNGVSVDENGNKTLEYRDDNYLDIESGDSTKEYYEEDNYGSDGFDVLFFNNKRRVIIFSRLPLPSGRNRVDVEVIDENGVAVTDYVEFMVDNYRQGFGFGRLLVD
jgi:hypothetical protein